MIDPEAKETDPTGRFIRYDEVLGRGAYKTVYKGFDQDNALEVAWNKLDVERLSEQELAKVSTEVELLEKVNHKNIISFYGCWRTTDPMSGKRSMDFITELMSSGTLKEYIRKAKAIKLKVIRRWGSNILEAINYLHTHKPPIMHRDLKCDNIFINGNVGEVKLGDLGLSSFKERQRAFTVIGTPEFMAPELYEESYTETVDVYAFGMCLLEMVTMEYPYMECQNPAQIFRKVLHGEKPASLIKLKDGDVKDVILMCLEREAKRPSAGQLLEHPLFKDWASDSGKLSNVHVLVDSPFPEGTTGDSLYSSRSSQPGSNNSTLHYSGGANLKDMFNSTSGPAVSVAGQADDSSAHAINLPTSGGKPVAVGMHADGTASDSGMRSSGNYGAYSKSNAQIVATSLLAANPISFPSESPSTSDINSSSLSTAGSGYTSAPAVTIRSGTESNKLSNASSSLLEEAAKVLGEMDIGVNIPVDNSMKLIEFSFNPGTDQIEHVVNEMVTEFQLEPAYFQKITSEIEGQIEQAVRREIESSRRVAYHESQPPVVNVGTPVAPSSTPVAVMGNANNLVYVVEQPTQTSRDYRLVNPADSSRAPFTGAPANHEGAAIAGAEQNQNRKLVHSESVSLGSLHYGEPNRDPLQASSIDSSDTPTGMQKFMSSMPDYMRQEHNQQPTIPVVVVSTMSNNPSTTNNYHGAIQHPTSRGPAEFDHIMENRHGSHSTESLTMIRSLSQQFGTRQASEEKQQQQLQQQQDQIDAAEGIYKAKPKHDQGFALGMRLLDNAARGKLGPMKNKVKQGADVNFADYDKRTCLHLACAEGHLRVVEFLIDQGADVDACDRWGASPVDEAKRNNRLDILQFLEVKGLYEDLDGDMGVSDVEVLDAGGDGSRGLGLGQRSSSVANSEASSLRQTALEMELLEFCARGFLDLVRERLMAGASAAKADYDLRTPLHLAASEGHEAVAELLIMNGANMYALDRFGRSPIDDAIKNGHREVLKVFRSAGAVIPLYLVSEMGSEVSQEFLLGMDLIEQASKGRLGPAKTLLELGADPGFRDYDNRTPLHLAAAEGHLELCRFLLEKGATPDVVDRYGSTAVDEARKNDYESVVELLTTWHPISCVTVSTNN
eukprot:CAMPEP_0184695846 /NCGR_PEP_ID=MMETSP0313-20130426/3348_1 /TAXON_ID=2792 /ORGANISM="Porphyridium aerugineum, Strain SAG 1380-2" /LENGTH=1119 /DNA_ID=CAMNT_0027154373 /DNA_START=331 /DNA_END=3690 /DNA_ORIENTATION=-